MMRGRQSRRRAGRCVAPLSGYDPDGLSMTDKWIRSVQDHRGNMRRIGKGQDNCEVRGWDSSLEGVRRQEKSETSNDGKWIA
jgi:hypothetical protein